MYERLYAFLNNNNIIYHLQFGVRQKCSAPHALTRDCEQITFAMLNAFSLSKQLTRG